MPSSHSAFQLLPVASMNSVAELTGVPLAMAWGLGAWLSGGATA